MTDSRSSGRARNAYVRACVGLARAYARFHGARASRRSESGPTGLARALSISGLPLSMQTVVHASEMASLLSGVLLGLVSALCAFLCGPERALPLILMAVMTPLLLGEIIKSYPKALSRRIASEVVKDSTGAITLMVMSLRSEPSLPNAILFSCRRTDSFTAELRACTWGVIMGRFASFEDALQSLSERWSAFGSELKTSIDALITASCEATEEGRRRALDRANNASVLGVKRRIEEYALSLSTPSMVMFGLAILLPLMVGSFLPMMSWDVWSASSGAMGPNIGTEPIGTVQVVFIMNFLFPAMGLLVAMGSVARHPLESSGTHSRRALPAPWIQVAIAICGSCALSATAITLLDGVQEAASVLLCVTLPASVVLILIGVKASGLSHPGEETSEETLFRMGARMVEGVNYESALYRACKGRDVALRAYADSDLLGGADEAHRRAKGPRARDHADAQTLEALGVVRGAASKDERASGLLAMDLASYIRDLRETERSLRSRLKPTISMMKITSFVLAPIVLGITFAMYMPLGAIAGESAGSLNPALFFLVLGAFLAESNAVVQYFVWGVEGRRANGSLATSLGACIIVAEILFVATALVAG